MCEPTVDVCACGDPTCPRGPVPWMACQNPDRLIDAMLRIDNARAKRLRRLGRAGNRNALIFRATELARRG